MLPVLVIEQAKKSWEIIGIRYCYHRILLLNNWDRL